MDEDYRVKRRSDDAIEAKAKLRRKALVGEAPRFDVFVVLERAGCEFGPAKGLQLVEKLDAEMGRKDAYVRWKNGAPRIFVKRSIAQEARDGESRPISILIHELAHIVLEHRRGEDVELPRMVQENTRPTYIELYESAEHQARVFTAEFLMPRVEVQKFSSPQEIQVRFGVSWEAATYRYREVIEKARHRKLPDFGGNYLDERKRIAPAKPMQRSPYVPARSKTDIDKVWEAASLVPGRDPSEYRSSRNGFPVKRSDYLKTTPFGWFVHNNQVHAHCETDVASQPESEICTSCGNLTLRRNGLQLECATCGLKLPL